MNEYLLSSFRQQLKADPTSRVFLRLAEELRKGGEYNDAVSVCEDGLKHHPRYVPALVCLGRCQKKLGQTGAAEKVFCQVLDMTPDNSHALRGLSDILIERDNHNDALPYLETLSLVEPSEEIESRLKKVKTIVNETSRETGGQETEPDSEEATVVEPPPPVSDESHNKQAGQSQTNFGVVSQAEEAPIDHEVLDQTVVHEGTTDAVAKAMAEFESVVGNAPEKSLPDAELAFEETSDEVPSFDFEMESGPVAINRSITDDSNDSLAPPVMDEDSGPLEADMPMLELAADDLEDLDDFHVESEMEIDAIDFGDEEVNQRALLSDWEADEPHATVAVDPQELHSMGEHQQAPEADSRELNEMNAQDVPELKDAELPEISLDDLEELPDMPEGLISIDSSSERKETVTGNIDDIDREFERAIHEVDDAAPAIFGEDDGAAGEVAPVTSELEFEEPTRDTLREHVLLSGYTCKDYLAQLKSDDAVLTVGLKHEKMEHYEEAFKLYRFLMGRNPEDTRYREHAERVSQHIEQEDKQRRKIRLLSNWHDKLRGGFHVS